MTEKFINELKNDKIPVLEEFYTIQGEGFNSGKAAYFVRLGGCDLACRWCDSKESWVPRLDQFVGGETETHLSLPAENARHRNPS